MAGGGSDQRGPVTCGSWIRRPENASWVVFGRSRPKGSPFSSSSVLEIFSFDPKTTSHSSSPLTTHVLEEVEGDVVSIAVHPSGDDIVCSTSNGVCKLFELYGQESTAKLLAKELPPLEGIGPQKCLAFSVDGSKLATGGVDGHLRILEWPSLRIILDEPKAHNSLRDMDFRMKRLKRLHLGTGIETLEFCPTERVVLSTSNQWGAVVTKLTVPADWKEWQIYLVLLGLFLASAVAFYIFFENSDSFWNFPLGRNQPARPQFGAFLRESPSSDDRNIWGPVDM